MKIALGTAQFGFDYGATNKVGRVPINELKDILDLALRHDIDTIDTAISYGDSESHLGQVGSKNFKIVTKLPPLPYKCTDVNIWVREQILASLSRLGVTSVYALLLHRPQDLLESHGGALYRALQMVKDSGQVKKIGISIYSPNDLTDLIPLFRFDLVQAPFNLIDQRFYNSGWMKRLKDQDIEIHTRSIFLQGLLLTTQINLPLKFSPWNALWHHWYHWLKEHKKSALQVCLSFPLSFSEIDRVIVGVDSQNQLVQILDVEINQSEKLFPNLQCDDENLINPTKWSGL